LPSSPSSTEYNEFTLLNDATLSERQEGYSQQIIPYQTTHETQFVHLETFTKGFTKTITTTQC
jgi:hypothetical protein